MHPSVIVIGGGLSGLAAAIRLARFNENVLLLEKHTRIGGLNSYYYRNNRLFETGLHAITNYAEKDVKRAPLNRLLRQLKIKRDEIGFRQQIKSEICFPGQASLVFSNDFQEMHDDICSTFKQESQGFSDLVSHLDSVDPFTQSPYLSTRTVLSNYLKSPLLTDMLLCPMLYYGSSWENDLDFKQFTILFRSIYQEGFFRPEGSIKVFLDLLVSRYKEFGGSLRLNTGVKRILSRSGKINGVVLESGEQLNSRYVVSTIGLDETRNLLGEKKDRGGSRRLGFCESIFQLKDTSRTLLPPDRTCIFFNEGSSFRYEIPETPVDFSSGVISLPFNFKGETSSDGFVEVRTTNLANYQLWHTAAFDPPAYKTLKKECAAQSCSHAEAIIGRFSDHIVYQDSFTPVTIERFTGKHEGAIYGSPEKVQDGNIGYDNLVLAGTDQGFLGIVGSMLSGVSVVNQHILPRI